MKLDPNNKMTDATFKKFLAAASDLAFECSDNGRDGYKITRQAFVEMLRDASLNRRSFETFFHGTSHMN
jgi:hypothetical protein